MSDERKSEASQIELIHDPIERAKREVENGLRQFELMSELIRSNIKKNKGSQFLLRPRDILKLQEAALKNIHPLAGAYRNTPVKITGSKHAPPDYFLISEEVADLCGYVNSNWDRSSPLHLAAFLLWKLNWIHPFADGNGRTARAVSYAVMSIRLDGMLPGTPTIPEQIAANKGPYYDALEKADEAFERGHTDVSDLETMLSSMLSKQLLSIAVLSETSSDRLTRVMEFRIKRAPADTLTRIFGTSNLDGRLWPISLDQVVFQLASPEEIASAAYRNSKVGAPFPDLLAASDQDEASRTISEKEDASIFANATFDLAKGAALRLSQGVSVGLVNPSVSKSGIDQWKAHGALYIFRFGKNISEDSIYESIDFMLAKHLSVE
jgi:hypothetical protein